MLIKLISFLCSSKAFQDARFKSIPDKDIFKIMTSSGTSGQAVSKIFLDKDSSITQTKVLVILLDPTWEKEKKNADY